MKNNKIKEIILFILIALFFASNILVREVTNLDELWNYNYASNIANGLIPYRDFNMVSTPMISIIGGLILKVLGKELIIFRILNILLSTSIVFMTYKIMNKLGIKDCISYFFIIALTYVYSKYAMFDYNFAVSFLSLIILYLEIKKYNDTGNLHKSKNDWIYDFIIGILAGLCIITKQTTGMIISLVVIGYKLIDVRNKEQFNQYLKTALWRILGIIIPVIIMILYLLINNAFDDFIDYCIYGVTTFSNKISYVLRLIKNPDIYIKIFAIAPIFLLVLIWRYFKNKDKNSLILFCFGVGTLAVVYPISDQTHLMAGIYVTIISLAYILDKIIKKEYLVVKIFLIVFSTLFVIYQVVLSLQTYMSSNKNWELEHYKGLIIKEDTINVITNIDNYIENSDKKVYVMDSASAYYMIPINRYNKNYDMLLLGNLGGRGEQGQIEDLSKELPNVRVLIKKDKYIRNWQNPENLREWIIKNMKKQGEIETYDIYE